MLVFRVYLPPENGRMSPFKRKQIIIFQTSIFAGDMLVLREGKRNKSMDCVMPMFHSTFGWLRVERDGKAWARIDSVKGSMVHPKKNQSTNRFFGLWVMIGKLQTWARPTQTDFSRGKSQLGLIPMSSFAVLWVDSAPK